MADATLPTNKDEIGGMMRQSAPMIGQHQG